MSLPSSLVIAARLNNVVVSFLGSERSAQWFVLQIVGGQSFCSENRPDLSKLNPCAFFQGKSNIRLLDQLR